MINDREDFEDFEPIGILDDLIETQRRMFIEGCEEGYRLLQTIGPDCLNQTEVHEAKEALSRMIGHFIYTEEYEKCSFIKQVYKKKYKENITPIITENIYNG